MYEDEIREPSDSQESGEGTQEDADRSGQRPGAGDATIDRTPVEALSRETDEEVEKGDPEDPSTGSDGDPGIEVPTKTQSEVATENQEHREEVLGQAPQTHQ